MTLRPFHHQRPLFCCALFYGLGVAGAVYLPYWPRLSMAGLCLCLLGAFLLGRMGKRRTAGFMGAFLFLGLLLCGKAMHPALPTEGKFSVTGIVAEEVSLRQDGSAQGYLEQAEALSENGKQSLGTVYWTFVPDEEQPTLPTDGQRVSFTGKVYLPSGRENPYGFDFRMFLLQKGICCGVSGAKDLAILSQETRGLSSLFYRSRLFLGNRLDAVFGEESALPRALLLGERERLPEDVQFSFADAGVAHILSVSGLHVSLLAFLAMRLVPRRLGHRFRFWFLLVFLLFYLGIINFPAPAVRAGVFMLISRYRPVARRSRDWPTVVAAAFLLILLCSPLTLFSAMAQEESNNLSKRVKWGKRINAEKGRVPPRVFGYDKVDNFTLTINEPEARVVRRIFSLYIDQGLGCRSISMELNRDGDKTKYGNAWDARGVRRILTNPLYRGILINHKYEIEDFLTGVGDRIPGAIRAGAGDPGLPPEAVRSRRALPGSPVQRQACLFHPHQMRPLRPLLYEKVLYL